MAQGPSFGPYGLAIRSALLHGHPHPEVLQSIANSLSYLCHVGREVAAHFNVTVSDVPESLSTEWWSDILELGLPRVEAEEEEDEDEAALQDILTKARAATGGDESEIRSLSPEISLVV